MSAIEARSIMIGFGSKLPLLPPTVDFGTVQIAILISDEEAGKPILYNIVYIAFTVATCVNEARVEKVRRGCARQALRRGDLGALGGSE